MVKSILTRQVFMSRRPLLLAVFVVSCARALPAQMEHEHGGAPPAQLGRVAFSTSCAATAQSLFERGVALLHSFWYEESARAFRAAAAADTTCAMASWGLAMTYLHPLWAPPTPQELRAGAAAVDRARALGAPTGREQDYVEAIGAFYRDYATVGHVNRLRAYEQAMGQLQQAYPADTEGAIFHALTMIAVSLNSPHDTALALDRAAGAILEPLFQRLPRHPGLAHYLIHAYDSPELAQEGARAADRYAGIAPDVPHARHMPSHIYTRLGMWDASIRSNIRAATAARAWEQQQHLAAVWDQRLHAMDYLAYAYLQQGRDAEARRVVADASTMRQFFPEASITAQYAAAAIPARYALERGRWRAAADLTVHDDYQPPAAAVTRFARALGAARAGDTALARSELPALAALDDDLARRHVPQWSGMVHAQRLAVEAWLARATGDPAGAVQLAAQAADLEDSTDKNPVTPGAILPARELLGDLLLELGRPDEAKAAYAAALAMQPGRARSLAGGIRAAELSGDQATAHAWTTELRALTARSSAQRRTAVGAR